MTLLILKVFLTLLIVQALVKFTVFFFVPYAVRRKMLDSQYAGKTSATKHADMLLLGIVLVLTALLFATGKTDYLSFAVGLYAGMTLIQIYFHHFSKPLPSNEVPQEPLSPIKIMSYAIQANPGKPWKELAAIAALLLWILYSLATKGFGWF